MIASNMALAFREIRKNLFRSALTILGVVIGVASVIAIVTIGNGAAARITENISGIGENLLIINSGMERRGPPGPGRMGGKGRPFSMEDVRQLRESIPGIQAIAPTLTHPLFATTELVQQPVLVTGTTTEFFSIRNLRLAAGTGFVSPDSEGGFTIAVLGPSVAAELFGDNSAIGQILDLDEEKFVVTGVLESTGGGPFSMGHDSSILVPIETLHRLWAKEEKAETLFVNVNSADEIESVTESLSKLLRERRGLTGDQRSDFQVSGMEQLATAIRQTTGILTAVIGSIAGISLLVGGIGIMNVMLVTVTERTREIGVRMAIGALPGDVMFQFLVESSMLTAFGGILGIALGLGGGALATYLIGLPFQPSPLIISLVFLFSILLGVVFGFLPARRAARLNPIDALRHE